MKLLLLLELADLDVLCVQETWMATGAPAPEMPGYHVIEQRHAQGAHGGLATYYRQSIQLVATEGNEYGLYTRLVLPTSQRINNVNVYMPPTSSLARRDIAEAQATAQLALVLEHLQP